MMSLKHHLKRVALKSRRSISSTAMTQLLRGLLIARTAPGKIQTEKLELELYYRGKN